VSLIHGRPIVWGAFSLPLGDGFRERIDRRAIARTFREKVDVRAFVGHDVNMPIGRLSAGTLSLAADTTGLLAVVDVPDEITWGHDLLVSRGRRDQSGWSIGFRVHADAWELAGAMPERTIVDMTLFEVSTCCLPAYPVTEAASLRSGVNVERVSSRDPAVRVLRVLRELWEKHPEAAFSVRYGDGDPSIRCTSVSQWERGRRQMRLNIARQRLAEVS
jgi:uncharacterized protein